ncbi:hypothetical protein V2W45_757989 [Cenococcum geophilum]
MASRAIPSHLKPSAAAGNGDAESFARKHHGKTQSHVVGGLFSVSRSPAMLARPIARPSQRQRHPHTRTAFTSLYLTLHGLVEDISIAGNSQNRIDGLELPCKKKPGTAFSTLTSYTTLPRRAKISSAEL